MFALSGTLTHFMPVQILRLLQLAKSTGRLEVHSGDQQADLFLIDGRSGFAVTNGWHLRLGDLLVESGDIQPEAIELFAAVQSDQPGSPLGRMLVESGILEPDRLRHAVLEVQRRVICGVLLWDQGRFVFHPGERARDEDIMLDLDLDRLILEALRQAAEVEPERRQA